MNQPVWFECHMRKVLRLFVYTKVPSATLKIKESEWKHRHQETKHIWLCHYFGNPLFVLLSHKAVGKFYCRVSFLSIPVRALSWACAYEGLQVEEIQTMPGKETDMGIPYCWWFGNLIPNHLGNGAKTSVNHGGFLPQLPFYSIGFTVAGFLVAINSIEGIHPFLGHSQPSMITSMMKNLEFCSRAAEVYFHTIWGAYIYI